MLTLLCFKLICARHCYVSKWYMYEVDMSQTLPLVKNDLWDTDCTIFQTSMFSKLLWLKWMCVGVHFWLPAGLLFEALEALGASWASSLRPAAPFLGSLGVPWASSWEPKEPQKDIQAALGALISFLTPLGASWAPFLGSLGVPWASSWVHRAPQKDIQAAPVA